MARFVVNSSHNRIEIYFDSKPSADIRDYMKANRWRWNPYEKFWFHFNSAQNRATAQIICDMAGGSSTPVSTSAPVIPKPIVPKPQPPAPRPQPTPKKIEPEFQIGEEVSFYEDGNWYMGRVLSISSATAPATFVATISFLKYYYPFSERVTIEKPFSLIRKKTRETVFFSELDEGRLVEYETGDNGIRVGVVNYINSDETVDIHYFRVEKDGAICREDDFLVSPSRVIQTLYTSSAREELFHLKENEKVEFYDEEAHGLVVGKVTYLNYDGETVDVEYNVPDEDGYKWYRSKSIVITELTKLKIDKKNLKRSDFISEERQADIDFNESIKQRIQSREDAFVELRKVYSQKPLFKHQKAGCLLAEKYDKFAFFYDTGTGKTVMALDIIESKHRADRARFLIIAPKSIIKTAWLDDASNFYPSMRILPLYKGFDAYKKRSLLRAWRTGLSRSTVENDPVFMAHIRFLAEILDLNNAEHMSNAEVDAALSSGAQHYIINPEMFIRNPEKYIKDLHITGLIMDESAILKNYESVTSKVLREVSEHLKYVYLLSGKPAPNNEMEFFSQMKIVAPEIFPYSYARFLASFCLSHGRRYVLDPENRDLFAEMVSAKSLIISKKDCLDLPDTVEMVRLVELSGEIMADYDELYYECMAVIKGMDESSHFYSTHSKMAVLMKLRQMASGFFMIGTGKKVESRVIVDIHKAKMDEVNAILDEIPDEQVIIWCQFQHEIEVLEEELNKRGRTVTAYGKTKHLEENIDDFKNGRAKYIIAHPKTLKYGVTFVNCHYAIYYSFSYSAEDYDQSHDRNYRLGQKESCTYFFLQAADTIDEIMYAKVMRKLSSSEFFEQLVKDAAKHGINYAELKPASEEKILEATKAVENSALTEFETQIIERSEQRIAKQEKQLAKVEKAEHYADLSNDFFDMIPEPSEQELNHIEWEDIPPVSASFDSDILSWYDAYIAGQEQKKEVAVKLICSDGRPFEERRYISQSDLLHSIDKVYPPYPDVGEEDDELDYSRVWYYECLRGVDSADTHVTNVRENDELTDFLDSHHASERWITEMYRLVFLVLNDLPEYRRDIIRMKYGLDDGIFRANATVGENIGYIDIDGHWYTCNATRVALELYEGMEHLKSINAQFEGFRSLVAQVLN